MALKNCKVCGKQFESLTSRNTCSKECWLSNHAALQKQEDIEWRTRHRSKKNKHAKEFQKEIYDTIKHRELNSIKASNNDFNMPALSRLLKMDVEMLRYLAKRGRLNGAYRLHHRGYKFCTGHVLVRGGHYRVYHDMAKKIQSGEISLLTV